MNWDQNAVDKLTEAFQDKYKQMFPVDKFVDRKNRSAIWNKYLKNYDCKVVRNDIPGKNSHSARTSEVLIQNFIKIINFQNESVANSIVIRNPDRFGQYIIVSQDMGERILVIGMI